MQVEIAGLQNHDVGASGSANEPPLVIDLDGTLLRSDLLLETVITAVSTCMIASANWVFNEWLYRELYKRYPIKHRRPSVSSKLRPFQSLPRQA